MTYTFKCCDLCGKQVPRLVSYTLPNVWFDAENTSFKSSYNQTVDICDMCCVQITNLWRGLMENRRLPDSFRRPND